MKWLRTCFTEIPNGVVTLRGLRDDGQLFMTWETEKHPEIPATLRLKLDSMLNDPALPPEVDEETGAMTTRQINLNSYKGVQGWVEEPA